MISIKAITGDRGSIPRRGARIQRTWSLTSDRFYWVGMWEEVSAYCRSCKRCGLNIATRAKPEMGALRALRPLDVIAIDFTTVEKVRKVYTGYYGCFH